MKVLSKKVRAPSGLARPAARALATRRKRDAGQEADEITKIAGVQFFELAAIQNRNTERDLLQILFAHFLGADGDRLQTDYTGVFGQRW